MKRGGAVGIIGPLGNGFNIDIGRRRGKDKRVILVAGGNGVAPLLFLAEKLSSGSPVRQSAGLTALIGGRSTGHVLCEKEFRETGAKVLVATEDGSRGHKGLVTDLLKNELNRHTGTPAHRHTTIYACGPTGMLKVVAGIAQNNRIPCQVSLEERMACGVGVCLGCPVKVKTHCEYKMVCKDGPVFDAEDIAW